MKGRFWAMTLLTAVAAVGFAFGAGAAENIRAYYVLGVQDTSLKMDESRLSPSSWPLTGIGSSKTFTATPPAGYNVSEWLWKGATTLSTLDMDVIAGDVPTYTVNYSGEGSRTLGVRFEYIPLTVSFKANGGSGQSMASIPDKNIDSSFTLDSNQFTRPGYSFAGWTNTLGTAFADGASVTGASFWDGSSWSFKSDLYAVWTQSVYTVTFDANGGSTPTPSMPVTYGETYGTLPTPTWTGHSFDGWYTDSTGGSKVTGDSAVLIVADQTLYARWSEMYIVTFQYRDFNGNPASVDSPYIKRGESTNPPASDVVDQWRGHRFTGWEGSYENVTANRAVSAKYEAVKYTVKYDRNCGDATGDMADSQSRDYGVSWDLPQNQFVRPGYEFREWTTKADGSGSKYGDGASVSDLSSEDGATVTLYAQWTPITYWIEFNGGTGSSGSMATIPGVEYGAEVVLPANGFTKPGCEFQGWKCNELFFFDGATVSNLTTVADVTVTLVAMWDAPYWVAFDSNGGAGEMAVQRFEVGEEKALSPNEFLRMGYTFGGWATNAAEAAALTVKYVDGAVVSNLTDKVETNTLYAVWNTNAYYVAFDPNGGTGGPMEPQKFFYDQPQNLAVNSYSRGERWTFGGWSNTVNGAVYGDGVSVCNLCSDPNGTNTLLAVWQFVPSDYSVALDCSSPDKPYFAAGAKWNVDELNHQYGASSMSQRRTSEQAAPGLLTAVITNEASSTRRGTFSFWWAGSGFEDYYYSAVGARLSFSCGGQTTEYVVTEKMVSDGNVQAWSNVVKTIAIPAKSSIDVSFVNTSEGSLDHTVWVDHVEWTWIGDGDAEYTVAYDPNCVGYTGTMQSQTKSTGESWNLSMNEFVRTGYVFNGWNTEPGGDGDSYEDGAAVENLSYEDGATVTLYAQWTPISYAIAFNGNGGTDSSGAMTTIFVSYGVELALPYNTFTMSGYTFDGWSNEVDNVVFADGAVVSNLCTEANATNTLVAVWRESSVDPGTYTVFYDPNCDGYTGAMPSQEKACGATWNLSKNAFARDGYEFVGWNAESGGGGASYADGASVNFPCEDGATVTLYAQWKLIFVPSEYSEVLDCDNLYFEAGFKWNIAENNYQHGTSSMCQIWDGSGTLGTLTAVITNEFSSPRQGTLSFWWAGSVFEDDFYGSFGARLSFAHGGAPDLYEATAGMVSGGHVQAWSNVVQTIEVPAGGSVVVSFGNASEDGEEQTVWVDNVTWTWDGEGGVEYAVVYDSNGADSGTMTNQTRHCGETWNLSMNEFAREGYVFAGWNTESGGSGDSYADGASVNFPCEAGATVTLFAQWTPVFVPSEYSEALDCDNLYFEADAKWNITELYHQCGTSSMYQEGKGSSSNPGWLTASITNKSSSARQGTLSFWWAGEVKKSPMKRSAELTFAYCGQTSKYVAAEGMVSSGAVQEEGWSNVVQAIEVPANGSVVVSFSTMTGSTTSPLAVWVDHVTWTWDGEGESEEWTVVFNAMGGEGELKPCNFPLDTTVGLPACTFAKDGCVFAGWSLNPNGSKQWSDQESVSRDKAETVTVYAIWLKPGCYGIAFDPGVENAEWSMDYQSVAIGGVAKLNPCSLSVPAGKRFAGWRRNDDGRRYDDGVLVFNLADNPGDVVTLTAIWEDAP